MFLHMAAIRRAPVSKGAVVVICNGQKRKIFVAVPQAPVVVARTERDSLVGLVQYRTVSFPRRFRQRGRRYGMDLLTCILAASGCCKAGQTDPAYFAQIRPPWSLTTMLCKEYGLDPLADGVVICHQEA